MIDPIFLLAIPIIIVVVVLAFFSPRYVVVPPHQAHVVVTRGAGRKLFTARTGERSSYFFFPLLHKRTVLPLRNKQLLIENIPLRDKDLAKFICDVVCWINITDPVTAAERIGAQDRISGFVGIEDDIKNLVRAVTRNSSMKMDVVRLMSQRLEFSKTIGDEISTSIKDWGVTLVDLECIHFVDQEPYTVIKDLEQRQAAQINSTTRKTVAERNKEAVVVESTAKKVEEATIAENEEIFKSRQIERDEKLGQKEQRKVMSIAEEERKANLQKVEAGKALTVGEAKYRAEAQVEEAKGAAESVRQKGKADADVIDMTGSAQAEVIRKQAFAEAAGIDKKADAQKKYQQAGAMAIEVITKMFDTYADIQKAMFESYGPALEKAKIELISTGEKGSIMGIPIGAEGGIAMGGFLKGMSETSGIDFGGLVKDAVDVAKDIMKPSGKSGGKKGK